MLQWHYGNYLKTTFKKPKAILELLLSLGESLKLRGVPELNSVY